MDNKKIFDNYLTGHYAKCEKTNFNNDKEVLALLNKNKKPIEHNLGELFKTKISKESKVLDLGCGYGSFLYFLKSHNYKNVIGIDLSTEELAICRKFFESYEFYQEDIFDYIHETKEKFDVIYLSHVLEHIKKDQLFDFLEGVRSILTESGYFILIVPNSAAYFNAAANRYGDLTHEIGFSDKSLMQLFMQSRFKKIEVKNYFGVGSFWINFLRKISIFAFEMFIQLLGYEKQEIFTPSILVITKK